MHDILIKSATPQEQQVMSDTFLRECTLLSRLRHPHIVQFLGVCYLPGSRLPLLVMERLLMSLDDLLENKTMSLPFDAKLSFLRDVAKGLVFLHSQTPPVIHRDLTARNVLLNSSMVAKIADLGVARIVNIQPGKVAATMTKNPGNVVYMPPEAAEESAKYSTALDMFSYGNLAIFTVSRLFPDLKGATYSDSRSRRIIARSEVERRIDVFQELYTELGKEHELVMLSEQCLSNYPEERPSANEVMEHLARVNPTGRNWEKTKLELLQDVATAESEGAAKVKDIDDLNKKVDDKDNQLVKLQEENHSLHQTVTSLTEQLQLLQKQVQDKEKDSEALERRNQILQQQVRSQEVQLQEKKEQEEIDLASLPDYVKTSTSQEKKEPEDIDLPGLPDYLKTSSSTEVLRKNLSFLYQHLDPAKVLPVMSEKLILTPSEAEELSSYQHDSAKSMALVSKMFFKTGNFKLSLLEALTTIPGQEYVGTRLKKELIDDVHKRKKSSLSTSDELGDYFLQLLEYIMVAFDNYPNGVDRLKQALSSLVLPLGEGKEAALVQPGVYQDAQTTREFFKCMSPYFSPLSTDLLQLLTSLSGCDAAAKLVDDFGATGANNSHITLCSGKKQTKPLFSARSSTLKSVHNTPLDKLQLTQSSVLAKLPEHQTVAGHKDAVRVSVQVNRLVMSLSDYDSLVTALCGFFSVPKAVLAFVGWAENPLMLSWVVSSPVHEYMKSHGGGVSGEKMVAQERVMSIAVGQDAIYKCLTTEESELHEASLYGLVKKVRSLLKLNDINVNIKDYDGWTPLMQASFKDHEKVVELLLTAGAKVDLQNKDGFTALYSACQNGHEKIVQLLIQAGANLNLQSNDGWTPLKSASFNGREKVVELLLAARAKVDLQDKDGFTALFSACQKGHDKIVQLLIQAGANLNLQSNVGLTPLKQASFGGHEKVVELLLTAGAKVDLQDKNGFTALFSACQKGHDKIVQLLIQAGANLNLPNNIGSTPLMKASANGHEKVVELLLTAGAKDDLQDEDGFTALYVACEKGHEKIVQLLIQAGANLNHQSNDGVTPLMHASQDGHEKVVELLLTAGAKVDLQNKFSKTALSYARSEGHTNICRLLQNK